MLTLTKWFFFILASSFSHINHFYLTFQKNVSVNIFIQKKDTAEKVRQCLLCDLKD
ncbi:hypothetical protein BCBMB205_12230 [Bacillus sp. CN2]|nr:hypothetical protein BCBMB205_12230 [Bacillus velezensis]ARZ57555.1 hypothetical protein BAGQ_1321 [Bacillus velezensis]GFR53981.1 hypothetical protein BCBMB205_12230 [Bacillus sp. CN2]